LKKTLLFKFCVKDVFLSLSLRMAHGKVVDGGFSERLREELNKIGLGY
jgi:hypothetical protein